MRLVALSELVARDLRRSVRAFTVAGLGIAVGIASLTFFLGLSAGMREVVLGKIFPNDRIEIVPQESSVGAVVSLVNRDAPGIEPEALADLRATPGVKAVFPKMKLLFPSSGRGGAAVFGRNVGMGELVADGIDPALVTEDIPVSVKFEDPIARSSNTACKADTDCTNGEYCDTDLTKDGGAIYPGKCGLPIPAIVSAYVVEVFDGIIAPSHRLPRLGQLLARRAEGLVIEWDIGRAGLGQAAKGQQRRRHVRVISISPRAIDIGFTVPLDVARNLNREFVSESAAENFTSAIVQLKNPDDTATVAERVRKLGLEVKTSGAEQMGLLVAIITAVLSLTSVIVVVVASINIAHVFFTVIAERKGELGLMRALGATRSDVRLLVIAQAASLGLFASAVGLGLARAAASLCNYLARTKLPQFPFKPDNWFVFSPTTLLTVLGFGIAACVLSALAPSARAAAIEPAAALAGGV